jgi:hypothetical protein
MSAGSTSKTDDIAIRKKKTEVVLIIVYCGMSCLTFFRATGVWPQTSRCWRDVPEYIPCAPKQRQREDKICWQTTRDEKRRMISHTALLYRPRVNARNNAHCRLAPMCCSSTVQLADSSYYFVRVCVDVLVSRVVLSRRADVGSR